METDSVLVLGSTRNRELADALFESGLAPIVRETLEGVLKRLRCDSYCAVVLDQTNGSVDALEFVLNIRDMDANIPIVIVGEAAEQIPASVLLSQEHTFVLNVPFRMQELIQEVRKVQSTQRTEET